MKGATVPLVAFEISEERHKRLLVWLIVGWAASVAALALRKK